MASRTTTRNEAGVGMTIAVADVDAGHSYVTFTMVMLVASVVVVIAGIDSLAGTR